MAKKAVPIVAGPRTRRPFEGWGSATARGLAAAGRVLGRLSVLIFGQVRAKSERAYADFQKKRPHARLRIYAFASYGCIVGLTLLAQTYSPNSLGAYVRVEKVDLPAVTAVFIRNDSPVPWQNVKVTLNGRYGYEVLQLKANDFKLVRVDRFTAIGVKTAKDLPFAPPDTEARHIAIDCDRGHFEKDLRAK